MQATPRHCTGRHRGTQLLEAREPVRGALLVCPYHAWSYRLDGALQGLPKPETFPGLCKADHGLIPVSSIEAGGIIWAVLDRQQPADFSSVTGELAADFDALGLPGMHLYRQRQHEVRGNRKLIMDAFLESYHIQRLHSKSIAPFFFDGTTANDRIGPHMRAAVIVSPDYVNLLITYPQAPDRTLVDNFMLIDEVEQRLQGAGGNASRFLASTTAA